MVLDNLRTKYTTAQACLYHLGEVKRLGCGASTTIATYVTDQIVYEAITNKEWQVKESDHAFLDGGGEHARELMKKLVDMSRLYSFKAGGRTLWTNKGHPNPAHTRGCIHHEHTEGEKCYLQGAQLMVTWE